MTNENAPAVTPRYPSPPPVIMARELIWSPATWSGLATSPITAREKKANNVYFSATLEAATWGAELAQGEGRGRIYIVEPTGAFADDPNLTDKKFPGNPREGRRGDLSLAACDLTLNLSHVLVEGILPALRAPGQSVAHAAGMVRRLGAPSGVGGEEVPRDDFRIVRIFFSIDPQWWRCDQFPRGGKMAEREIKASLIQGLGPDVRDGKSRLGRGHLDGWIWWAGNVSVSTLTLAQDAKKLTGSLKMQDGQVLAVTGAVEGNKVKWAFVKNWEGNPLTITYEGTVDDTGAISGWTEVQPMGIEGAFTAKKQAAK